LLVACTVHMDTHCNATTYGCIGNAVSRGSDVMIEGDYAKHVVANVSIIPY